MNSKGFCCCNEKCPDFQPQISMWISVTSYEEFPGVPWDRTEVTNDTDVDFSQWLLCSLYYPITLYLPIKSQNQLLDSLTSLLSPHCF